MRRLLLLGCGLLALAVMAADARGQGVLIVSSGQARLPRPGLRPTPQSYKIKELTVNARINDQVAQVQVGQSFVNTGSRQMEVSFVFPLPYDGAIEQLTFMVDGKEYSGKLLPANQARSIYEGYIRRNQDPALLEWMGMGMFKTSVFPVPPGAERIVTLRYSQLLRKDHALTDFLFPLSTAKYTSRPVEKVSIRATIEASAKIKSVYSPTHSIDIKRSDNNHAVVKYEARNSIPSTDFRLFYDTSQAGLGASLLSYRPAGEKNGYFMLLATPEIKAAADKRPKKTVIFVVDRSGSMSGKKMDQAKEALRFVLNNLRQGDLFNVVAYDSSVESFRPELQKYDDQTRKAALGFVEGIYAGGSTNIGGALSTALDMVQDPQRPNYVLFLTDGLPTAGETNESKLVAKAKQLNRHAARIISMGVGYDVNSRLLDRLTYENRGKTEFVRPDEDLEEHVSRLYSRISSPVMNNVQVTIDLEGDATEQGSPVNRVYPRDVPDLFEGEQLVLVGRYRSPGSAKVVIKGSVGDQRQKLDFPAEFVDRSRDDSYSFVEKLWAMRRIGAIIDELDLQGKNQELIDELVALSTRHGILTPYTSFLADDQATVGDFAASSGRASRRLDSLAEVAGRGGVLQRKFKGELKSADRVPAASKSGYADGFSARPSSKPQAATPAPAGGGPGGAGDKRSPGAAAEPADAAESREEESVRYVGKETIYRRGNLWIAANATKVDLEKQAKEIKVVKRFSDEYFVLVKDNNASENAVLAAQQPGEQLLIVLRGKIYRIE